jgi:hypothetical protein
LPLASYGIYLVVAALGGLALLAIFSMLAMGRKQEEDQDRLEIELCREKNLAPQCDHEGSLDNIYIPGDLDLEKSDLAETRILLKR